MSAFDKYFVDGEFSINGEKFGNDKGYFIIRGLFNHCPCGQPSEHLKFVLRGMEIVNDRFNDDDKDRKDHYEKHLEKVNKHFGSEECYKFFLHWLDEKGYGLSCYGWLEDEGIEVLEMLREWDVDNKI